ncbi:hypothetical protein ACFWFI_05645 [Streptomyces sp. NPDC060209]|uniref:hypothetical protein n=1 Tax=Streptomyces sp. NPDC060209 TaxID=3347073 RepID=UPI0036699856
MAEDLLNQQAGTVHEETTSQAEAAAKRQNPPQPTDDPQDPSVAGVTRLMARQAEAIRAQALHRSTESFIQRLAARVALDARRPARVQYASAGSPASSGDRYTGEDEEIIQVAPPASSPVPRTERPSGHARSRTRSRRRRPTPINPSDPAKSQYLAFGYVAGLCSTVLCSVEIETLDAFAADFDEAGARTFGCLLYSLDKRESATYWWRFAAGAGDALAAHLLAAHHAAIGPNADSRAWDAFSRMLDFHPDRHVPQPVRHRTELADKFARELPVRNEARRFFRSAHLPHGLDAR